MARFVLDKIGMAAAFLCLAHCVLVPVLLSVAALPGLGLAELPGLEAALYGTSVVAGGWALWRGFRQHHSPGLLVAFGGGLVLLTVGNVTAYEAVELVSKGVATLLLMATHLLNWKLSRRCALG